MRRQLWVWYGIAVLVVLLDQLSKGAVQNMLEYGQPVTLLPVLDFTLQYNRGAAFSFLHDAGGWQRFLFSGIALIISAVLIVWLSKLHREQRLLAVSLALILGGAIGNLWDRLALGYVVDFISFHWEHRYFPAFNIADSAITVGAGLMLLDVFINPDNHREESDV